MISQIYATARMGRLHRCIVAVLIGIVLGGCGRNVDVREWHPLFFPFYAAHCYGKSAEEKAKNQCNLTKEETATLDRERDQADRQQMAATTQRLAQSDARFTEQKAGVVADITQWMDAILRQLETDPRTRLDRAGPSTTFNFSQRAIRDEYEKCIARLQLGEATGGAPCEDVMRWQLDAATSWLQRKL